MFANLVQDAFFKRCGAAFAEGEVTTDEEMRLIAEKQVSLFLQKENVSFLALLNRFCQVCMPWIVFPKGLGLSWPGYGNKCVS